MDVKGNEVMSSAASVSHQEKGRLHHCPRGEDIYSTDTNTYVALSYCYHASARVYIAYTSMVDSGDMDRGGWIWPA